MVYWSAYFSTSAGIAPNVMRLGAGGKSTPNNQINNQKIKTQTDD